MFDELPRNPRAYPANICDICDQQEVVFLLLQSTASGNAPAPTEAKDVVVKACPAAQAAEAAPAASGSLFERLGGKGAVEAAVDVFYKKVLADPQLSPFFAGLDMARQRNKQVC